METQEEKPVLPIVKSPLAKGSSRHGVSTNETAGLSTYDETLFENPEFEHHEETSNIQLFFDLFFVANLTSFTNSHEINSLPKLSSYIGFFTVLWITWVQVTLYDVRFATDSILERVAHACHFGVMVGLAIIGPQFNDPNAQPTPWAVMQQLSLILMASRLVLFCQYSSTLFFIWRYRASRWPLIAVIITLSLAVFLYLGISFAFYRETARMAYVAWYVVGVCEVISILAIALWSESISFRNTHLVERMTCLTLIILGEGIIGLTKTITKIETLDFAFSPTAIGGVISGTLIIYFLYQLYFDNVRLEPFNSIRQMIWAGLHFPFHMALVLLMEGINQAFVWSHISEDINVQITALTNFDVNATGAEVIGVANSTVSYVFSHFPSTDAVYNEVQNAIGVLNSTTATPAEQYGAYGAIVNDIVLVIFSGFGWTTEDLSANSAPPTDLTELFNNIAEFYQRYLDVFSIAFAYFCISGGVVLIGIGIFTYLSYSGDAHHHRRYTRYLSIISSVLIGIGLALFSTAVLTDTSRLLGHSSWTLPLLLFLLLILIIVNHFPDGSGKQGKHTELSQLDK